MEGIASCRECGNTVRGKIGVDLKCACGRVFKIPDEPIYHANKPAPLEKLKNVPIMSLLDFILDSRKAGDGNNFPVEFSFSIQPVNRLSGRNSSSGSNGECFARRPRPDLFVEGRKVLIVADLPDHKKIRSVLIWRETALLFQACGISAIIRRNLSSLPGRKK